jgi:vacuolar-type H+-ATPase subunit I/STV1
MFEFFKTMENFENAINNPNVVIQNNPETCVSPEEPNYLDLRNKAKNQFEVFFNDLIQDYDEIANEDETKRLEIDNNIGELFNRVSNNNKKSEQELNKLETQIDRLDKELDKNVSKIEEQKSIISRNKSVSEMQNKRLENSSDKSKDIQKWYVILLSFIVLFIALQSFVLFKL